MIQKKKSKSSSTNNIKPLLVKKTTTLTVYHDHLSEYIKSVYGKEFDIVDDQKTCNYSLCDIYVNGFLSEYDEEQLEKWLKTGYHSYLLDTIMNDMCKKKIIKPGHYIVHILW